MKASIININEAVLYGAEPNECGEYISGQIFSKGGVVESQQIIKFDEAKLSSFLTTQNDIDFVFVLVEEKPLVFQKVKESLAVYLKDELIDNSFAQNAIENYYNSFSLKKDKYFSKFGLMPRNSKCIVNKLSKYQGFYAEFDGKIVLLLPSNLTAIHAMMEDTIVPLVNSRFKNLHKNTIYKLFGLTKEQTLEKLEDILSNKNKIKVNIYQNGLEQTIKIEYSNLSPIEDVNNFIAELIKRLSANIFAVEDLSIYEIAFYLLKANKKTLAIAESITGGNIAANLIKYNSGISEYLKEGVVTYTIDSKINRLNMTSKFLDKYTDVSPETAYEMCAGLLETSSADICISTCGYSELPDINAGYAFIAVGDNEGIHIYKTSVSGTRQQVIEMVSKSALFHLIKKFKK